MEENKLLKLTAVWHNSGVAGFESSQKLINFGVWLI
jgi:hypothetical protein